MLLPLLAILCAPAAAETSLLRSRPSEALVDEVVELRPVDGHHFNVEAPQKCGTDKPLEVLPRRLRCQMTRPGVAAVLVSVCDDALTFCRQESFDVAVRGAARAAAASSPMTAPPRGAPRAPEGFLDNAPAEAQARARREGKLLLVDFHAIWCPPCNDLEEHSFPTPEFRAASKDFVKVALDADSAASFGWKTRFKVGGYPTLIVADPELREIGRIVDYRSGPALARFLEDSLALRDEPVAEADRLAARGGPEATEARRLRAARWRAARGEFAPAEALLDGQASDAARKELLLARRERARIEEDAAAWTAATRGLLAAFPDDAAFSEWASDLAQKDAAAARPLADAVRRSADRWPSDPSLGAEGYDPGDVLYGLASFLDAIGSTAAARGVWSRVADAYAAQAAKSPLPAPRAANFGRGEALRKAGRAAEAKTLYESLVKSYPEEFTFNFEYASALKDDGDATAAYPYAVAAERKAYGDNWLRAVKLKAELELELGRADEAARTVDEALGRAVPPKSAGVRTYRYIAALRALRREIAAAKKG